MDASAVVIVPCALIALIVVVITIRPSASSAVAEVLRALAGVLAALNPWAQKSPAWPADPSTHGVPAGATPLHSPGESADRPSS
jgi:hypothetical protein